MKTEVKIFYALVGAVLMWLVMKQCGQPKPVTEYVHSRSDTLVIRDSLVYVDRNTHERIIYRDSVRHQLTFDDSVDIWYRMQYAFYATDSVYLYDSTGVIFKGLIEDSIYSNRITWRQFSGQVTRPVTIVSQTFEPVKKRSINLGLSATGNRTSSALYIDLGYTDLKDFSYTVGYNLIDKGVHLGVQHPMLRFE